MSVLVVGGGWAGLAAAVELAHRGRQVTLIEATPTLGGRARSITHKLGCLDNGQHILLGAYRQVLYLLEKIGVDSHQVFRRGPLKLNIRSRHYPDFRLNTPLLPAPWHLFFAVANANGISRLEKTSMLKFAFQLRTKSDGGVSDQSVRRWLVESGQTKKLISLFWAPLCIAALNTPAHIASSQLFAHVLRLALLRRRTDSDLLLPTRDLGEILPIPAEKYLVGAGCQLVYKQRVTGLQIQDGKVLGVHTDSKTFNADQVIVATSSKTALRLLEPHSQLASTYRAISNIHALPIYTAYLQYSQQTTLKRDMLGLHGYTSEWLFDRGRLTGQCGMITSVISAAEHYTSIGKNEIIRSIIDELATLYPSWPPVLETALIRESEAAFTAEVDIMDKLPRSTTPINGLWLAGDYTRTYLPATLESAVTSGINCSNAILKDNDYDSR
ncbi:hydroxysqualene dehydroxylase HpnE [Pseudomonadota bacterium]